MNINYEEVLMDGSVVNIRKIDADGTVYMIPISNGNSDYQAYLKYLEDNK